MFWKKKQAAAAPVGAGPTVAAPVRVELPATKAEVPKVKVEKLPGPKELPFPVGRDIVVQLKKNPDWVWSLKAVVRKNPRGKKVFDVRVFSDHEAAAKKVKVRDYTSLDEHPELILFEGWFDKATNEAQVAERKTA